MLDKILQLFNMTNLARVTTVINICTNVVKALEQEFSQNKDEKNAAIDALIELLNAHKEVANSPAQNV